MIEDSPPTTPKRFHNESNNNALSMLHESSNKFKMNEQIRGENITTSISKATINSWSTLPKRLVRQLKFGDSSVRMNSSYNIENGALSIRKKNFPQLEVTIGSRTLERSSRGRDSNSVVLEPIGKSDHLDDGAGSTTLIIKF